MAVLIAWAVPGRADDKPAAAPTQTGAITGLVVDLQGHPVAGADGLGRFPPGEDSGPPAAAPTGGSA